MYRVDIFLARATSRMKWQPTLIYEVRSWKTWLLVLSDENCSLIISQYVSMEYMWWCRISVIEKSPTGACMAHTLTSHWRVRLHSIFFFASPDDRLWPYVKVNCWPSILMSSSPLGEVLYLFQNLTNPCLVKL